MSRNSSLREYYGINKEGVINSPNNNNVLSKQNIAIKDSLSLDNHKFSVEDYLNEALSQKSLSELLALNGTLSSDISTLEASLKSLLYENYSKFIDASEAVTSLVKEFGNVSESKPGLIKCMNNIEKTCYNDALSSRRSKINKLTALHSLLKRQSYLLESPKKIKEALSSCSASSNDLLDFIAAVDIYHSAFCRPSFTDSTLKEGSVFATTFNTLKNECLELLSPVKEKCWKALAANYNEKTSLSSLLMAFKDGANSCKILVGIVNENDDDKINISNAFLNFAKASIDEISLKLMNSFKKQISDETVAHLIQSDFKYMNEVWLNALVDGFFVVFEEVFVGEHTKLLMETTTETPRLVLNAYLQRKAVEVSNEKEKAIYFTRWENADSYSVAKDSFLEVAKILLDVYMKWIENTTLELYHSGAITLQEFLTLAMNVQKSLLTADEKHHCVDLVSKAEEFLRETIIEAEESEDNVEISKVNDSIIGTLLTGIKKQLKGLVIGGSKHEKSVEEVAEEIIALISKTFDAIASELLSTSSYTFCIRNEVYAAVQVSYLNTWEYLLQIISSSDDIKDVSLNTVIFLSRLIHELIDNKQERSKVLTSFEGFAQNLDNLEDATQFVESSYILIEFFQKLSKSLLETFCEKTISDLYKMLPESYFERLSKEILNNKYSSVKKKIEISPEMAALIQHFRNRLGLIVANNSEDAVAHSGDTESFKDCIQDSHHSEDDKERQITIQDRLMRLMTNTAETEEENTGQSSELIQNISISNSETISNYISYNLTKKIEDKLQSLTRFEEEGPSALSKTASLYRQNLLSISDLEILKKESKSICQSFKANHHP